MKYFKTSRTIEGEEAPLTKQTEIGASMILSPWISEDGYCCMRVIHGTDPDVIGNRVAYIEKTPRCKLRKTVLSPIEVRNGKRDEFPGGYPLDCDYEVWMQGPKGSGGTGAGDDGEHIYGFDDDSRNWCDSLLLLMGYVLLTYPRTMTMIEYKHYCEEAVKLQSTGSVYFQELENK